MTENDLAYPAISTSIHMDDFKPHYEAFTKKIIGGVINTLSVIDSDLAARVALKTWSKVRLKKYIPRGVFGNAIEKKIIVNDKKIVIYEFGQGGREKIILCAGWLGQGSDFYRMVPWLVDAGYDVVAFDAPAHGQSEGDHTTIFEFVEVIEKITKEYGGFKYAVGHSMGGLSLGIANTYSKNLNIEKMIIMGAPNKFEMTMKMFGKHLGLNQKVLDKMKIIIEDTTSFKLESLRLDKLLFESSSNALLVYDSHDDMVPFERCEEILKMNPGFSVLRTHNLGHVKILRDKLTIQKVIEFINKG